VTTSDLGYALRQLVLRPGHSAAVVLMLALGIGATTAIYSLFHQILVQPLPVPEPDRLVNVVESGQKPGNLWCAEGGCNRDYALSYSMLRELEARQDVFTGIAGHHGPLDVNLAFADQTHTGAAMLVSGAYFQLLNLRPALGRLIGAQDEPRIGESAVAVLSHGFWLSRFGGDPSVVGRALTVNGRPLTIIGVAPAGFSGTLIGARPDIFVPLTLRAQMQPAATRFQSFEDPFAYWLYAVARLESGVTLEQAAAHLAGLHAGILDELQMPPEFSQERQIALALEPGARGQGGLPTKAGDPLRLLLAVTVLLMLLVCINISSLVLARNASRGGEIAVRASLGAERWRIAGQLLTEAAVPAVIGILLGLPVAAAVLRVAESALPARLADGLDVRLDPWAVLLAISTSLAAVLLVALVPAAHAARTDASFVMKAWDARGALGGHGLLRLRGLLATAQIAISMVLLALAGLFAQSLANVARVDLGFDADSLVFFNVSPGLNGYDRDRLLGFGDRVADELAARPNVTNVARSLVPIMTGGSLSLGPLTVEGLEAPPESNAGAATNAVGPGFFATLSMPLLAGRDFTENDAAGAPRVAIVNESFLRKFRLGEDALGRRFGIGSGGEPDIEIIGIVADSKYATVKDAAPPQFYTPLRQQDSPTSLQFYVRAGSDPNALLRAIPAIVSGIDPNLPVGELATMRQQVGDNVFVDRLVTMLTAGFAGLATLLAAIGLYGVLSYGVVQRTRELGVRLALGAEPKNLRGMVLRQVGAMTIVGGLIGLVGALAAGRAAESLLFGLSAHDPFVLAGAGASLGAVAIAAGYLPASRASRIAPMDALRHE
jgi:predicted permease